MTAKSRRRTLFWISVAIFAYRLSQSRPLVQQDNSTRLWYSREHGFVMRMTDADAPKVIRIRDMQELDYLPDGAEIVTIEDALNMSRRV